MRKLKLLFMLCVVAIAASAADFTDGGKYYLKNVASGKYWSAGNSWGTQASLVDHPEYVYLHLQSDGQYTIESQVSNGGNNKYFGGDYMDSGDAWWLHFDKNTEGKYTIYSGTNYFGYDGATTVLGKNLDATSANVLWEVYSEAEMRTLLEAATVDAPVDATWLMLDPNFGRNNRWSGNLSTNANNESLKHADLGAAWTFDASNKNIGGDNTNCCVESYQAVFTMSQALTSVPNGTYRLTAQGFYRQDGTDNDHLPYFYANDEKQNFPLKTGSENSMTDASNSFKTGAYTIEPIWVYVTDGNLTVGAKNETNTKLWCIWDNFVLTYYGNVTITEAKLASFVSAYKDALAAAQSYQSTDMFDTDKAALNTAISENTLDLTGDVTEEQLTTATNNLNAAAQAAATAALKYATYTNATTLINGGENVDLTSLIVNPSFEQSTNGWTVVGGLGPQSNNSFGKTGTYYLEYWQPNGTKSVSQTVGYLPAGLYKMTVRVKARGVSSAKIFAAGINQAVTVEDAENEYTVNFALDEKVDALIGFEGVGTGAGSSWIALDNFRLTYVGALPTELTAITGKMNKDVADAQTTAVATYNATQNVANYNAASAAIAAAQASVDAYVQAAAAIARAEGIIAETNVFAADKKTAYQGAIDAVKATYEAGTMTDAEATALENTLNGGTAYKPTNAMRDFYTSAWTATNSVSIYTNNWSTEGNTDGSNFTTPFIEDWVADANSLANTTISASVADLATGTYKVTAKVRLRLKNGGSDPVNGVSLQVSKGEAVAISGAKNYDPFYVADVEAIGYVTETGDKLDINFIVNNTNASWLSIKAVNYERTGDVELADADDYAALNTAINAHVLGFEKDEYAPYNNIDAAKAVAAAKAIDQTVDNAKPVVIASIAALNAATWTANTEEVNAFYKGDFADYAEDTATPLDYTPAGWTATANFRLMLKNTESYPGLKDASAKSAVMSWSGGITYGETAGYEMPLKANTTYLLSFKAAGWNNETRGNISVSVLNGEEGLALTNLGAADRDIKGNDSNVAGMTTFMYEFTTGAVGNYVFTVKSANNMVLTDFNLMKAPDYTIAGDVSLFRTDWDVNDANNELTLNADGTYSKTFTNVALNGNVEYKVVKNHDYANGSWPQNNQVIGIKMPGNYDVTIHFNPATNEVYETMALYKNITAAKYATLYAPYDLNFEGSDVTAYIAKLDGTTVSFEEVTSAPANTGLLLKADAEDTYKFKMEASTQNVDENKLKGVTEDTKMGAGIYVLLNTDNKPGFYKTKGEFTVGAYTAYLPAIAGAREFIGFGDDTTTGIDAISTKTMDGEVYNLNGQRVNKAHKGLYIVNGKKVVLK